MTTRVRINATVLDAFLEDEGHPGDEIMNAFEGIIQEMKDNPGDVNDEVEITIVNDFEAPDDEDEDEDESTEETEPTKEA